MSSIKPNSNRGTTLSAGVLNGSIWLACVAVAIGGMLTAPANAQPPQGAQTPANDGHTIEAYVSEDALQVLYSRDLVIDDVGRTDIYGGVFFNEERDLIAIAGALSSIGEPDFDNPNVNRRLRLRVGPRMYGAFLGEDQDIFGIALGGEASYGFGADRSSAIVLSAFYAPDILTFGTADNISDVSLRFETRLRANTTMFVGYRNFEIDVNLPEDREVDDSVHIGFRRDF